MSLPSTLRSLRQMPVFTAAVVSTIALGVGASSAIFSVFYAVLLRPLPYPDSNRLVMVWETLKLDPSLRVNPEIAARLAQRSLVLSRILPTWRQSNHVFEDIGGFAPREFTITGTADPERVEGLVATAAFLPVLGVQPIAGRAFMPAEDEPGRDDVVVLSHAFWQRRFGGDPHVIGRTIGIDGAPHTVIGVLPADFCLVLPNTPRSPALITPISHAYEKGRLWTMMMSVARLEPGVTIEAAQADMAAIARHLADIEPRNRSRGTNVFPLAREVARDSRRALWILLAATGCVLLVAAVNVTNLLLLRAGRKQREMAIRTALGASRIRLVREAMGESLLLALIGAAAGLLLARWGVTLLVAWMPEQLFPRVEDIAVTIPVWSFALVVSVAVGLVAGAVPAWQARRSDRRAGLSAVLKESAGSLTSAPQSGLLRRGLVALEVGVAMTVLVAAVLLAESYMRLTRVDLGVRPERVLTFDLTLPSGKYTTEESRVAFTEALMLRLQSLSGVDSAAITSSLPVKSSFTASVSGTAVEGQPRSEAGGIVLLRMVYPGLFRAAGMRLAYGRLLANDDMHGDATVVNRAMVRRHWPAAPVTGPEPIGRRIQLGDRWRRIVGVVEDVKYDGPDSRSEPEAYVPYTHWPVEHFSVVMRTPGDPLALVGASREAVKSVDPDLPLTAVRTLEDVLADSVAPPRFRSALIGAFAALAILLALIGLYGVISQSVTHRARELGVRVALGAAPGRITRMVIAESSILAIVGVGIGVAISLAASKVLAGFLFGTSATDALTYAVVGVFIITIALAASYGPARRAAHTDPVVVLRSE